MRDFGQKGIIGKPICLYAKKLKLVISGDRFISQQLHELHLTQ